MSIRIFYDGTKYRLEDWKRAKEVITKVIEDGNKQPGDLNFILTNDKFLREINVQFLEHDYNTDVIAFNYSNKDVINGEVYISLDTVKINADNYKVSLREELLRVLLHGVLHLLGYDDKTPGQRRKMRKVEDRWLLYNERLGDGK